MSAAIGRVLAGEKTIARLSVRELAKRAGISYSVVNRLLNGERELSAANFIRLCDALNVDPAWVLTEVQRRSTSETPENRGAVGDVSEGAPNVTRIRPIDAVVDWDEYEGSKAADYDSEADEDEPTHP